MIDIRHDLQYVRPMKPQPKPAVERDDEYLDFIRSEPCIRCSHPAPSAPHHHPLAGNSGTATKTSDYRTLPLCHSRACHPDVHQYGRETFWGDLDAVEHAIEQLNTRFFFTVL